MFVEIFPDPLTPSFYSVIQPLFHSMLDFTFKTWGFKPPIGIPAVEIYYNQPYFNRSYIEASFGSLSAPVREPLVAQIVNPFGDHKGSTQSEFSPAYLRMVVGMLQFLLRFPKLMPSLLTNYHTEVGYANKITLNKETDAELVGTMQRLIFGSTRQMMDYDFLLIAVIKRVYHLLGSLLEPYFGEEAQELRGKLISGVSGNATMETNLHLWDLAQMAKNSPQISELVREYSGRELVSRLGENAEGQAFLDEFDAFLNEFGHREVRLDIYYPTWVEDPTPVFNFIRGYLEVGEEHNPRIQGERLVEESLEIKEKVRRRLNRDFRGRVMVWPLFKWLLDHIEFHTRERDTMHFEMTRLFPPFRRIIQELGQRWYLQGLINDPDDIYFLTLDEMAIVAKTPKDMSRLAKTRRAEWEQNKKRPWPNIIRGDKEIYPEGVANADSKGGQLTGVSGSPGVITGPARVICGPEEFHRLNKGDILVAPITNPVWTPLFAIAAGVVTEVGGILSHGAIVAREYGIPAVMSIAGATNQVLDGQTITVDGNSGSVYIGVDVS
jgi:pyruvate,water dikinase